MRVRDLTPERLLKQLKHQLKLKSTLSFTERLTEGEDATHIASLFALPDNKRAISMVASYMTDFLIDREIGGLSLFRCVCFGLATGILIGLQLAGPEPSDPNFSEEEFNAYKNYDQTKVN